MAKIEGEEGRLLLLLQRNATEWFWCISLYALQPLRSAVGWRAATMHATPFITFTAPLIIN